MKTPYEKYAGMLMTLPENIAEEELPSDIPKQAYEKDTFDRLVAQARQYTFRERVYIDGDEKQEKKPLRPFTPENMVIRKGELYAVWYYRPCAVGYDIYVIPLCRMERGPYLASSHVDRYDDYGDHDSWTVDIYIEMIRK